MKNNRNLYIYISKSSTFWSFQKISTALFSLDCVLFLYILRRIFQSAVLCWLSGQIRQQGCTETAFVQYQYCDGWGVTLPYVSFKCIDNWKDERHKPDTTVTSRNPFQEQVKPQLTKQSYGTAKVNSIKHCGYSLFE